MEQVEVLEHASPRVTFERVTTSAGTYWRVSHATRGRRSSWGLGSDGRDAKDRWLAIKDGSRCVECGDPRLGNWIASVQTQMDERRLCHHCNSWTETLKERDEPTSVRVGGEYYTIGPKPRPGTPDHCLGFAGRRFLIRFHDGRGVETNNLWTAGEIPEHFRSRLPDNAVFIAERDGVSE